MYHHKVEHTFFEWHFNIFPLCVCIDEPQMKLNEPSAVERTVHTHSHFMRMVTSHVELLTIALSLALLYVGNRKIFCNAQLKLKLYNNDTQ